MTLLQPWFLLGLLGLSIPILLHLFELRRPQRVLFTNVDFIRDVKLVTAKQRRLQHLLVLALRLGFVAFLVLLFCQPFIRAKQQTTTAASQVNIVVDDSPSMVAEANDGKPLLERANREAEAVTVAFPTTVQYQLWAGNASKEDLSGQMLKEALAATEVTGASRGAGDVLRRVLHQKQRGGQPTFVLSDFQRSDFGPNLFAQLRGAGEVYLLPLSAKPAANIYTDSVYLVDEFVRAGVDLPLQVRLRNGGNQNATVQVRVLAGQRQVGAFEAELAAGASTVQTVRLRLTNQREQLCRVEIEDQPVTFDNTYYFTLTPAAKIRILDVSSSAPATQRLYPNEVSFSYSLVAPGAVGAGIVAADMVLLQGDARLSEAARAAVRGFVSQGGLAVIVPPAAGAVRADYEQLLADLELASVRWNAGTAGMQELALPDRQSPFFKDVFSEQTRQPDMPRATPLLSWSRSSTDVLKFRDGQPFLSGFRSGQGMVYTFASPLQAQYSTFAAHPLFVPVMYRLAALSKTSEQLPAYRLTDRSVVLRAPALKTNGEQLYKLSNDSSSFVLGQQVRNGRLYLQLPPTMRQPGFYRLTLDGQPVATLAFNVDKQESELTRYSAEELRELTAAYPNVHVYEAGGERSAAAQFAEERTGTPLWRYCLVAALLCLLGEVLVLRFGQRRTTAAAVAA